MILISLLSRDFLSLPLGRFSFGDAFVFSRGSLGEMMSIFINKKIFKKVLKIKRKRVGRDETVHEY